MRSYTDVDTFNFDDWLESVGGHTVRVTAPSRDQLGPQVSMYFSSPINVVTTYCEECDEYHKLVKTDPEEIVGHCPVCEREP